MLSHLAFLIDKEIPKQSRTLTVLNLTFIRQVMFGRFFMLEFLDRQVLSMSTNSVSREIVNISVASSGYSGVLMLHKLIQWLPKHNVQQINIPWTLFPLPREPPVVRCSTLWVPANLIVSHSDKTFTYGKNKKRFIDRF